MAADACRLAQLIAASPGGDPEDIAREYGNWRTWIDEELHEDIGVRALMWSAAFCDGGKRKTVLRMAEAFRSALGCTNVPMRRSSLTALRRRG